MWITEVPNALVTACLVMLPRLEAEEAIGRTNTASLAAGRLTSPDADALMRDVMTEAAGGAVTPADPSAILTAHGITVRKVPRQRNP